MSFRNRRRLRLAGTYNFSTSRCDSRTEEEFARAGRNLVSIRLSEAEILGHQAQAWL